MTATLKRLPLHELHAQAGAHFGHFGEWEVPLYFSSILEEHDAVRNRVGLFDISHMGEFLLGGREAKKFLDRLLPRRMNRLADGKALYAPLLNENGGIVDDLIVYQLRADQFLLIVNAANIDKDFTWIHEHLPPAVELENVSEAQCLFSLQGPQAASVAEAVFRCDFSGLRYYQCLVLKTNWGEVLVSRTGYTGEDGFEVMAEMSQAESLWRALSDAGKNWNLKPIGFGARDTLRLEAGMLLYGQDMNDSTSALEAGLEWAVDWEKDRFIGRDRNVREKKELAPRRLVGFEMIERGVPRHGCPIERAGRSLGEVTSGSFAPTLKKNIGLGYVARSESRLGGEIEIVIRNQKIKARITPLPFYQRASHGIS